jgi:PAS domain-containing protein
VAHVDSDIRRAISDRYGTRSTTITPEPQRATGVNCVKILRPDGALMHINAAGRAALGISPLDTQLGMPWLEILPSVVRDSGRYALNSAASGIAARFLGLSVEPDGTTRQWANELAPVRGIDSHITEILCISMDITLIPHGANFDNPPAAESR